MVELRTSRLLLRPWREEDLVPWAAMNADPQVRRWFPGLLDRAASDAAAARMQAHIDQHGFGFWAIEAPGEAEFVGMAGLMHVTFEAPFAPAVEAGWRLARGYWGRGYATEAARVALDYGFGPVGPWTSRPPSGRDARGPNGHGLGLQEIVAFAVPGNTPSRRVMERVGMTHDPASDFDHPALPESSPLRRHVLYRVQNQGANCSAASRA